MSLFEAKASIIKSSTVCTSVFDHPFFLLLSGGEKFFAVELGLLNQT